MFVLGNFLEALARVLGYLIEILKWLIIIRALLSWVNPDPYNPIVQFIERTTEPILAPLRRLVPAHRLGIDISPILAFLILYFLQIFLIQSLIQIAFQFK